MLNITIGISSFLLTANSFAHGISESSKQAMIEGGYLQYVWLGAEHMITGYDHLLFLLGVIFFLTSFTDIVKFISAFTIGHSITLILATFLGVSANYWIIDAVIALSVCYKGLDNNGSLKRYLGLKKSPNLLLMVFIFGLIHGFGLSTRLQQLPLGEKGSSMLMRIISFNVGVELGQVFALVIMLFILNQVRRLKVFSMISKVSNDGLVIAGGLLFLMQMHGYLHQSSPDEFGFSEDSHIHHHLDLEKVKQNNINKHDNI
ncbi:HupE/UreJ family protein [Halobacteriovorax sp.]|uniref:HupE/UreJ family protein n=1 Tax=Halobacteriovorax sp. TaxID=2020862 RepID=UPI0035613D24